MNEQTIGKQARELRDLTKELIRDLLKEIKNYDQFKTLIRVSLSEINENIQKRLPTFESAVDFVASRKVEAINKAEISNIEPLSRVHTLIALFEKFLRAIHSFEGESSGKKKKKLLTQKEEEDIRQIGKELLDLGTVLYDLQTISKIVINP